jgi:hypothetical protein
VLKIALSGAGAANGLKILADNSTVEGLVINNWENGVFLATDATGITVQGNFIGTDASGTDPLGNNIGVVASGANNTVGGTKGQVVTATATDQSTGDTSEFSNACTVPEVPCP